jgi:hypothetical protein
VIAVKTIGASLKRQGIGRRTSRRRPSQAEPGDEVEPVSVTRVTVIRGQAFEDGAAAQQWFAGCRDAEAAFREVAEALRLLNHAIHAHRVSAADPYVGDVSLRSVRRIRLGYGTGDELVEGRWREAYTVPPAVTRGGRRRMLAPEEQLARILGGRRPTHPSEDLLLRARLDFDQGRMRAAALQADAACAALAAELRDDEAARQAFDAVRAHGEPLARHATAARDRDLGDDEVSELGEVLVEMERVARRRRHAEER